MGLFERLDDEGPRVAFLGIDGVPYRLIEDNPDVFTQLHALIDRGTGSPIDSVYPPESSACWPALTTGSNPGETGVFGFQERAAGGYDTYVPQSGDMDGERVWDRVQAVGRSATVLNVPVTYPPQPDVQRMVSGFLAPGIDRAATDDDLVDVATDVGYRIDVDARLGHADDKSDFFADAHDTLEARYRFFDHYIEQDDWDLFFGVFMTPDRVNHFAFEDYEQGGPNRENFLDFYRKLDAYIGRLSEALPDDVTLVIGSDHGFTTLDADVDANAWLQQHDWLSFETTDPTSLTDIAPSARAYALVPGRFYLNLEGREPRGAVPRDAYDTVRSTLKSELESATGPVGEPLFDRVVARERVFSGRNLERAPDLVGIPTNGFDLGARFDGSETTFMDGPRNGMHTFDNATLIVDEPVDVPAEPTILDIAPIILDRMHIEDGQQRAPAER